MLLNLTEALFSVLRFDHGGALALEHPANQPAYDRLVVDDKDEISPDPRIGRSRGRARLGHWRRRLLECYVNRATEYPTECGAAQDAPYSLLQE